jgi:GAF domain-containing protein
MIAGALRLLKLEGQEEAQLGVRLENKEKELKFLNLFLSRFVKNRPKGKLSQSAIINALLDDLVENTSWNVLAFWQFIPQDQVLELKYHRNLPEPYLKIVYKAIRNRVPVGSFGSGRAIATRQPVVINDWTKDPLFRGIWEWPHISKIYSFAAFPVISKTNIYGTFHAYGSEIGRFKLDNVEFFTIIANVLAARLEVESL